MAETGVLFNKAAPCPPRKTEKYLSSRRLDVFPSPTGRRPSHARNVTSQPPNVPYPIPMVHNNYINNPNLYSTSSTYHEFSAHSFRGSRLANEEARFGTVASSWDPGRHPGHVSDSSGSPEEADFGEHSRSPLGNRLIQEPISSVPSTASHQALIMGYSHLGYSQRQWSVVNQHARPHHPVTMNRDHSFTRSVAPATYNPIRGKHPCSTSAFHMASVLPYRPHNPPLIPLHRTCKHHVNAGPV